MINIDQIFFKHINKITNPGVIKVVKDNKTKFIEIVEQLIAGKEFKHTALSITNLDFILDACRLSDFDTNELVIDFLIIVLQQYYKPAGVKMWISAMYNQIYPRPPKPPPNLTFEWVIFNFDNKEFARHAKKVYEMMVGYKPLHTRILLNKWGRWCVICFQFNVKKLPNHPMLDKTSWKYVIGSISHHRPQKSNTMEVNTDKIDEFMKLAIEYGEDVFSDEAKKEYEQLEIVT